MGLALLLRKTPSSWTVPYHLSFVKKFAKKNAFDHQSFKKWSTRSILETLREKERVDPVVWFPEQTINVIWWSASSPELSNKHQGITWLVVGRTLPVRSFMYTSLSAPLHAVLDAAAGGLQTVTHLLLEFAFAKEIWRKVHWFVS
eukprot:g35752.t1